MSRNTGKGRKDGSSQALNLVRFASLTFSVNRANDPLNHESVDDEGHRLTPRYARYKIQGKLLKHLESHTGQGLSTNSEYVIIIIITYYKLQ